LSIWDFPVSFDAHKRLPDRSQFTRPHISRVPLLKMFPPSPTTSLPLACLFFLFPYHCCLGVVVDVEGILDDSNYASLPLQTLASFLRFTPVSTEQTAVARRVLELLMKAADESPHPPSLRQPVFPEGSGQEPVLPVPTVALKVLAPCNPLNSGEVLALPRLSRSVASSFRVCIRLPAHLPFRYVFQPMVVICLR